MYSCLGVHRYTGARVRMQALRKRPSEGVFPLELSKTRMEATSPSAEITNLHPVPVESGTQSQLPQLQGKCLPNPLSSFFRPSTPPLGIVSLFLLLETEVCSAAQAVFKRYPAASSC